jgi:hypothetical protein
VSGVYSYCVLPAGHHPPASLRGIDDVPVLGHDVGRFTVWTSTEQTPPTLDLERITRHHQVVAAAAAASTPLPVRFGTWAPSHAALDTRIGNMSAALDEALAATSGRIEMGIRVEEAADTSSLPEEDAPVDGRGYLHALSRSHALRKARRESQDALVVRIREALGPLGASDRVSYLEAPGFVAIAHLIERHEESAYRNALASLANPRLHVTGPWPPYSFVSV